MFLLLSIANVLDGDLVNVVVNVVGIVLVNVLVSILFSWTGQGKMEICCIYQAHKLNLC